MLHKNIATCASSYCVLASADVVSKADFANSSYKLERPNQPILKNYNRKQIIMRLEISVRNYFKRTHGPLSSHLPKKLNVMLAKNSQIMHLFHFLTGKNLKDLLSMPQVKYTENLW